MISNLWLLIQSSLPRFVRRISRRKKKEFLVLSNLCSSCLDDAIWCQQNTINQELAGSNMFNFQNWRRDGKVSWHEFALRNIFLKSLSSSGEDLLASLIGFSDIRLIFKKHPIPRKPRRLRWPEAILNSSAVSACYNKLSGKIVSKLLLCSALESWDWSKQCTMGKLKNGVKSSQLWQIISLSILIKKLHIAPLTPQLPK